MTCSHECRKKFIKLTESVDWANKMLAPHHETLLFRTGSNGGGGEGVEEPEPEAFTHEGVRGARPLKRNDSADNSPPGHPCTAPPLLPQSTGVGDSRNPRDCRVGQRQVLVGPDPVRLPHGFEGSATWPDASPLPILLVSSKSSD